MVSGTGLPQFLAGFFEQAGPAAAVDVDDEGDRTPR
jgi:hypothetical protein